ncbi:MAG TPA: DUF1801 domain-containing protein [Dokdonella sp.]
MAGSTARTVEDYLARLPEERREIAAALRRLVLEHLPQGYVESMNWGMPCYEVPLARHPGTYNGQPLGYVAFAAQKNNYALYLMGVYADGALEARLRAGFERIGRKPDIGKSCVRFRRLEHLPLEEIGDLIASTPVDAFIAMHERQRAEGKSSRT